MEKIPQISGRIRSAIQRKLLNWYRRTGRDLPWRRTSDPYRILLAEFMLQQTQVETVIPYYERFLERFPTIQSLAMASSSDVLKSWEGLGYYARARNLHRAAQIIVERDGGQIPATYDGLSSLPGFGPYTTAAVLSIAFGKDYAVLDGNVMRVLCRLFGIGEDIAQTRVKKRLWELAEGLMAEGHAGDYNQAIMELGATVCRPRQPDCPACPLQSHCQARKSDHPETLPYKSPRKARPHHTLGVGIVWRGNELLIARRKENGLLGGLWEFPAAQQKKGEPLQDCCLRAVLEETGVEAKIQSRFHTVKHAFTHFSVTMHAFLCRYRRGRVRPIGCSDVQWASPETLSSYAFSRANRKLIDALLEADRPDLFSSPPRSPNA